MTISVEDVRDCPQCATGLLFGEAPCDVCGYVPPPPEPPPPPEVSRELAVIEHHPPVPGDRPRPTADREDLHYMMASGNFFSRPWDTWSPPPRRGKR